MRRLESQRDDLATKQDLQAATEPLKRDVNWIKWIGGIGFTALLTVMLYLHSDSQAEIRELRKGQAEINSRFAEMKTEMKEIKELLQRR